MAPTPSPQDALPVLRLCGVGKVFRGAPALDGVTLDLLPGEFLSLVGPSGCGKSTLLRLIAGLAAPSSGTIAWPRQPEATRPPALGVVFQDATLMPWATVAANVALPLRLAGVSRGETAARVAEALEGVALAAVAKSYPRELSGGMRMRVAIARALVTRPKVLLMDEPFAALDEITRLRLNDDLVALWADRGMSILFVTHSITESVYLSTRIAVMGPRPGRIFDTIEVPAPAPRDDGFRATALYRDCCLAASDMLRRATAA